MFNLLILVEVSKIPFLYDLGKNLFSKHFFARHRILFASLFEQTSPSASWLAAVDLFVRSLTAHAALWVAITLFDAKQVRIAVGTS